MQFREIELLGDGWIDGIPAVGDDDPQSIIERKEPAVERAIKQRVKTDAIRRMCAPRHRSAPGRDMAGVEQFGKRQPGEGAAILVADEDGRSEEALDPTDANQLLAFGWASPFREFHLGSRQRRLIETCARLLGGDRDALGVFLVRGPQVSVGLARVPQRADSAGSLSGVKAGEVAGFHRQRAGRSANRAGDADNFRILAVQPAEREPDIEPQRYQQLVSRPVIGSGHGHIMRQASGV